MPNISFIKYHGLGNDFVVIDGEGANAVDAELARRICARHFGVGADGVLLLQPSTQAAAKLVILNADGSRPEMCGNGLRCVALHLAQSHIAEGGNEQRLEVETDAGVLGCQLSERDGGVWVTTSLGRARIESELAFAHTRGDLSFQRVNVGNPHAVLFGHQYSVRDIDDLAPQVSGLISGGANIEFVEATSDGFRVIVWERGVGRTLACGTGAGAVAAAAVHCGRAASGTPLSIELPGGRLEVSVGPDYELTLTGPAERVFDGVIRL